MRSPPDGSPAHQREARLLDALQLGPADFAPLGGLATGTRRAATIVLGEPAVEVVAPGAIRITFTLPAGAYATAILREVQKTPDDVSTGHDGSVSPSHLDSEDE